jgi:hypothetical protein
MATGGGDKLYHEVALSYQEELKRYGVELVLRPDLDGFYTLKSLVVDNTAQAARVVSLGGCRAVMQVRRTLGSAWYTAIFPR